MGVFIIQFADTNHLTLHVHDRVLFGDTWQGFVHDNFEFERASHPYIECRGVITIVIGIGRGGAALHQCHAEVDSWHAEGSGCQCEIHHSHQLPSGQAQERGAYYARITAFF